MLARWHEASRVPAWDGTATQKDGDEEPRTGLWSTPTGGRSEVGSDDGAASRRTRRIRARRRRALAALLVAAAAGAVLALVLPSRRGPGHGGGDVASDGAVPRASASSGRGGPAPGAARDRLVESPSGAAIDPAVFTPGSCVAFSPTRGRPVATVFLDAGHGGRDPGAIGTTSSGETIYEAHLTLPVELDTAALLRRAGLRVVVSRTRQTQVARAGPGDVVGGVFTVRGEQHEIAARDLCADLAGAKVLVGIYFDAGASPSDAGSIAAYDPARPFWRSSLRLATLVQRDTLASMNAHGWQIPDDGVSSDVYLGGPPLSAAGAAYGHLVLLGPAFRRIFTTPSTMPGTIIEPLFITDPYEGTIAASKVGQHAIAAGIARGVEQYLGLP